MATARNSRILRTVTLILIVVLFCPFAYGKIIYVDGDANGANDGTSWENAYVHLQDALADAELAEKPVEIRVAQGIHKPDRGANQTLGDRVATFQLINGTAIRGGYAGFGEPDPDARNFDIYETILTGDLDGNNGPDFANNDENGNNVVTGSGTDETAVLDGLTITGAKRYGMYNHQGSPTLTNCTFAHNFSGMHNWDGDPTLTNCTFENNTHRGMENLVDCNLTLTDCTFNGNSGSAIHHSGGSLTLTGCLVSGNSGFSGGGIRSLGRANLTLHDCTFTGNSARASGGGIDASSANISLYNCTFSNNSADSRGGGVSAHVYDGDFEIEGCVFSGNRAKNGAGMEIWASPLAISNCVFAGNVAERRGGALNCVKDYVTIRNCTFFSNVAGNSGSAVYARHKLTATNSIFWDNTPDEIATLREAPKVTYCNIPGNWPGPGNINVDPYFAELGYWDANNTPQDVNDDFWVDGDYHLLSQAGRWDPSSQRWVKDDVTSPCIDAGDPNSPIGTEPFPNGGRVNMGAYSAGDKASKSYFGKTVCETIIAGDINGDCIVDVADLLIMLSHWMMQGEDFVNDPPIVILLEPQDGAQIEWPGPTIFRAEAYDVDGQVDKVVFNLQQKRDTGTRTIGFSGSAGVDGWKREFDWQSSHEIPEGNWTVWAEATDNEGAVGVSPEIVITLHRQ
ncbi:MAG: right-handed parallel beta-helix repeat-containing protein [Sedimentisphaerales bacterium]